MSSQSQIKIGRNEPCSCGSGKKFKKCCALSTSAGGNSPAFDISKALQAGWSAYTDEGNLNKAAIIFQKILKVQPHNEEAMRLLASISAQLGHLKVSSDLWSKLSKHNPNKTEYLTKLGHILNDMRQPERAMETLNRAIALNPNDAEAYLSRATTYKILGQQDNSIADNRKAIELKPDFMMAHTSLLYKLNLTHTISAQDIFEEHLKFGTMLEKSLKQVNVSHENNKDPERKLRIGYVSPDFRKHSVSYFVEPVIRFHNREEVESFAYYSSPFSDEVTTKFKSLFDHWSEVISLNDKQFVEQVRNDKIDILVDLAGYTAHSRLLAFVQKPAPIQISWLGYPNTTGLSCIDYRISDAETDPSEMSDSLHTETLLRLPDGFLCFQPPESSPEVALLPYERNGYITFGSFNNFGKITDEVLNVWADVLLAVPDSHLLLKFAGLDEVRQQQKITRLFMKKNISSDRLELLGTDATQYDHMNKYTGIDIGLDPFPYNGTTTTCEALWMGVPVITLAGGSHRSRVGASLLTRLKLEQYISHSRTEYINNCITLAQQPKALAQLRVNLRDRMLSSPLTDGENFANQLEQAYRNVWREWCGSK